MNRRPDAATVAMHVFALAVWPLAWGYAVIRLLSDRYPVRRTTP